MMELYIVSKLASWINRLQLTLVGRELLWLSLKRTPKTPLKVTLKENRKEKLSQGSELGWQELPPNYRVQLLRKSAKVMHMIFPIVIIRIFDIRIDGPCSIWWWTHTARTGNSSSEFSGNRSSIARVALELPPFLSFSAIILRIYG